KLYADIAHPINSACREMIQERVIKAFHEELQRSKQPGYVSSYDDFDEDIVATPHSGKRHTSTGGATKVEPAEAGPRGPHISPSADKHVSTASIPRPISKSNNDKPKRNDGFGAGIL